MSLVNVERSSKNRRQYHYICDGPTCDVTIHPESPGDEETWMEFAHWWSLSRIEDGLDFHTDACLFGWSAAKAAGVQT